MYHLLNLFIRLAVLTHKVFTGGAGFTRKTDDLPHHAVEGIQKAVHPAREIPALIPLGLADIETLAQIPASFGNVSYDIRE